MQTHEPGHYSFKVRDGYISVIWDGYISKEMAANCVKDVQTAAKELIDHDEPLRIAFSAQNAPALPNTDAFSEGLNGFKLGIPFQRIVVWGNMSPPVRALVEILIESYKKEYSIRYIQDEREAIAWLLQVAAEK